MPFSAKKIVDMLNTNSYQWNDAGKIDLIKTNHILNKPTLLFSIIEDDVIDNQVKRLKK